MTLARFVKRQIRNTAVLFSVFLFSFAFCHHSGIKALEVEPVTTTLPVDSGYYEHARLLKRTRDAVVTSVGPALRGDLTTWSLNRAIDGVEAAEEAINEHERTRVPREGLVRISSRFGMRLHPILKRWRLHNGVDFAAPRGTPVRAVADGVVLSAGWSGGAGRLVKIEHNGFVSGYAHLAKYDVRPGQTVRAGDHVGEVGASGLATGNHLHFMILKNGRFVNPLDDGLERLEPIQEVQVLVNIERGLGVPAALLGQTAAALISSEAVTADLEAFAFDDSFL